MAARLTVPFARGADHLALTLTSGGPQRAQVAGYDFAEHVARFGDTPDPAYVLVALCDITADQQLRVRVIDPVLPGGGVTVPLAVPAGLLAGCSVAVPLPPGTTPAARISWIDAGWAAVPDPLDGGVQSWWGVLALLGVVAKILWVAGWERDHLRRQLERTVAQRDLAYAAGFSLDLIGSDLGVPRFPALPYGVDDATVALYHLDDEPAGDPPVPVTAAADVTAGYPGRTGHPATLADAVTLGVPGRYGQAFAFGSAAAVLEAVSSTDFDVPADGGLTVECFVRPDPDTADGTVLSRSTAPADTTGSTAADGTGWVLQVGEFGHGLARNVRFAASDGTAGFAQLFADVSLDTDRYTHLAATLDRAAGQARLFVDGALAAAAPIDGMGALTPAEPLRIGPAGSGFRGRVDEVRVSSVARADFYPVLGEGDEHYRLRLQPFRRWSLPTPAGLQDMVNTVAGPVGGLADPFVLSDGDDEPVRTAQPIRVVPATLDPGDSIDDEGRQGVTDADAYPDPPDLGIDPAFLTVASHGPFSASVQASLANVLTRLFALIDTESPGGSLVLVGGFDPAAADLRAVGRGLEIRHTAITPGRLAALAHRAGAGVVEYRWSYSASASPDDGERVYLSTAPGQALRVQSAPSGAPPGAGPASLGVDVVIGGALTVSVTPAPPAGATVRWVIVPVGTGRVAAQAADQPTATLTATVAGTVGIVVEITSGTQTASGTTLLTVGLDSLGDGASMGSDGTLGVGLTAAGPAGDPVAPVFLLHHDNPLVDYGTEDDHHLMQRAVARRLDSLLAALSASGAVGKLVLSDAYDTAAFDSATGGLASRGRALRFTHETVDPGQLGALAQAAGFAVVERAGTDLTVLHADEPLLGVDLPASVVSDDAGLPLLEEGTAITLAVQPDPATVGAVGLLAWSSGSAGLGALAIDSTTQPTVGVTGVTAGIAWVQAAYTLAGQLSPYQFGIRLRPELDATDAVVSKDQYDLVMNVLNALHPMGVEVVTAALRARVVEVRSDPLGSDPSYTYPQFRLHRPVTVLRTESDRD
jgi:Concanavalin A-like lectin/glucanases superfamily